MISTIKKVLKELGYEMHRYDPQASETAGLQQLLRAHDIQLVVDIGANEGQYAMKLLENGYQGKLLSFEPLSEAYSRLKVNSSGHPNWSLAEAMAIGNEDGEIEINVASNLASSSVLPMQDYHSEVAPESAYKSVEKVPIKKLDSYLEENPTGIELSRTYLKIDVQGFEMAVFDGADNTLGEVKAVQAELSLVSLYEGQSLYEEVISRMKSYGLSLYRVFPGIVDKRSGRLLQMDGVFFRES